MKQKNLFLIGLGSMITTLLGVYLILTAITPVHLKWGSFELRLGEPKVVLSSAKIQPRATQEIMTLAYRPRDLNQTAKFITEIDELE